MKDHVFVRLKMAPGPFAGNSFFLFDLRAIGKTTVIRQDLKRWRDRNALRALVSIFAAILNWIDMQMERSYDYFE